VPYGALLRSWITIIVDPTVWLDGARPANTCIKPSFLWMAPVHCPVYPGSQRHWRRKAPLSGGYAGQFAGTIQGKQGGIKVLAGLAPSSQIVGPNMNDSWASKPQLMNDKSEWSYGHLGAKLGELVEATSLQMAPNRLSRRLFKNSLTNDTSPYVNSQTENEIYIIFVWLKVSLDRLLFPHMNLSINQWPVL
jgi:hypothetical protein